MIGYDDVIYRCEGQVADSFERVANAALRFLLGLTHEAGPLTVEYAVNYAQRIYQEEIARYLKGGDRWPAASCDDCAPDQAAWMLGQQLLHLNYQGDAQAVLPDGSEA
ncbi:MAG: hypothetical protein ACKVVP_09035 [Chloroflexota bacterium]